MGNWNSGRRPLPSRLQVLRGKTAAADAEPQPPAAPASFDAPPDELTGDAAAIKEWQRVVPLLRITGTITSAERSVLIALCQAWSTWMQTQQKIRTEGMVVTGARDQPIRNPHIAIANAAMQTCIRLWQELGLTPSARTKLAGSGSGHTPKSSRWGTDL